MKKTIAVLMAVVMLIGMVGILAGCGELVIVLLGVRP